MIHLAVNLFLFVVLTFMALGLFITVVVARVIRGVFYAFGRLTGLGHRYQMPPVFTRRCSRFRCGARNPTEANYCRRCGSPLPRAYARAQPDPSGARSKWVSSSVSL
jgi:ribosomal protein L40E